MEILLDKALLDNPYPKRCAMRYLQTLVSLASLTILIIVGCQCRSVTPPSTSPSSVILRETKGQPQQSLSRNTPAQLKYQAKQALTEELLTAAQIIAETTDNDEARAICEFLRANTMTHFVIGENILTLDKEPRKFPIAMLILDEKDMKELPLFADAMRSQGIAAAFMAFGLPGSQKHPLLIVDYQAMTTLWRGMLTLHEGSHAKMFYTMKHSGNQPTPREIAFEEVRVYEFEKLLFKKLGGKDLQALINMETERIAIFVESGDPVSEEFLEKNAKEYEAGLEKIFGKSRSEQEKTLRMGMLVLQAHFEYIDRTYGSDEKDLTKFIKAKWYMGMRGWPTKD